ncbi:hypothetical protein EYF80_009613 [Liparis tanakae]|uniref:Uncharacterized protein n=1 Tax=Liparis tanakae TaxID=230148 RepID=A0A4Z2IS41_9TELE|nr:hypothetical protein EYF80_009613 [Liparis tanakae]
MVPLARVLVVVGVLMLPAEGTWHLHRVPPSIQFRYIFKGNIIVVIVIIIIIIIIITLQPSSPPTTIFLPHISLPVFHWVQLWEDVWRADLALPVLFCTITIKKPRHRKRLSDILLGHVHKLRGAHFVGEPQESLVKRRRVVFLVVVLLRAARENGEKGETKRDRDTERQTEYSATYLASKHQRQSVGGAGNFAVAQHWGALWAFDYGRHSCRKEALDGLCSSSELQGRKTRATVGPNKKAEEKSLLFFPTSVDESALRTQLRDDASDRDAKHHHIRESMPSIMAAISCEVSHEAEVKHSPLQQGQLSVWVSVSQLEQTDTHLTMEPPTITGRPQARLVMMDPPLVQGPSHRHTGYSAGPDPDGGYRAATSSQSWGRDGPVSGARGR